MPKKKSQPVDGNRKVCHVYLTPDERNILVSAAEAVGLPLGVFIRSRALESLRAPTPQPSPFRGPE